jgi:hypothetical protein
MVFTMPATMFDKEGDGRTAIAKNKKNMIFEVIIRSIPDTNVPQHQERYEAAVLCGEVSKRNPIAVGLASPSVCEAMMNLLQLTMAELGAKKMKSMNEEEVRPRGRLDKTFF